MIISMLTAIVLIGILLAFEQAGASSVEYCTPEEYDYYSTESIAEQYNIQVTSADACSLSFVECKKF